MSSDVKKIGLYGGTFDPIHFGHLFLAVQIKEMHQLDEVWFFPTGQNPFKLDKDVTSSHHRIAMTKLAVADYPYFQVKEHECQRKGITYAIDTIRELFDEFGPQGENYLFSIIVGEDAAEGVFRWKEIDRLIEMVPFIVGSRDHIGKFEQINGNKKVLEALKKRFTKTEVMEISSTNIRERTKKGFPCMHLVPHAVLHYIEENRLYI